ncbi:heparan-alpha-glucosaminide N-acetyltransferase domain-containing protein [Rhodococcus sp. NPDC058514]|uniref:heparan-alpha-glucosaminide N-acetyltransferase domain-containing protein n=1 Tax=unclassified Rhodococcus (in: high G+C Gram-positive bacteria) TaxID=192944 RepID=UPI003646F311
MSHRVDHAPAAPARPGRGPSSRLIGVDVTRGLAILGMVAVHSLESITDSGRPTWTFSLAAGRSAAIFAVLAGVSIAFISGRRQRKRGARSTGIAASLLARAVVIGLIGLLLGYTDPEYGTVILTYYAVMFVLAVPLIYLGTRTLVGVAIATGVLAPVLSHAVRTGLPDPILEQLSFSAVLRQPLDVLWTLTLTGEYPAVVWMAYLSTGLVVGRLTLSSMRTATRLLATGTALMICSAALSWAALHAFGGFASIQRAAEAETVTEILIFGADGTVPTGTWWWLAVNGPHTGTPLDLMATIGSSLAVLGAALLLGHVAQPFWSGVIRVVYAPLAAVGTLSLTVYVGHIMFVNSDFDMYEPVSGYVRQVVTMSALALAWHATAGRGPLEGLVTAVTTRVRRYTENRVNRGGNDVGPAA